MKTLNTTPEAVCADIDTRPPYRLGDLGRVTLAAPGPVEIEPDNQNAAQRQAADERAQHAAYMAEQARLHGTGEVAEDEPGLDPSWKPQTLREWLSEYSWEVGAILCVAAALAIWSAQ